MRERNTTIALRTSDDVKAALRALTDAMSKELGTRVTQTQAMEMAIREALARRE